MMIWTFEDEERKERFSVLGDTCYDALYSLACLRSPSAPKRWMDARAKHLKIIYSALLPADGIYGESR